MRDDISAAEFLGYRLMMTGRQGPHRFRCLLYNHSLGATVIGDGSTRQRARQEAATKAIAQHQAAVFAASQALAKAGAATAETQSPADAGREADVTAHAPREAQDND